MNIEDLIQQYNFHDSSIESVQYDASNGKLDLTIEFCFWMQSDYKKGMLETGMILLSFIGVSNFNGKTGNYNSATILKLTPQSSNEILISLLDEYRNDYFEITIVATEVVMQII